MRSINTMVTDSPLDAIAESDIEQAVNNIVVDMDIVELLTDSDALKDAVHASVYRALDNVLEAYL